MIGSDRVNSSLLETTENAWGIDEENSKNELIYMRYIKNSQKQQLKTHLMKIV